MEWSGQNQSIAPTSATAQERLAEEGSRESSGAPSSSEPIDVEIEPNGEVEPIEGEIEQIQVWADNTVTGRTGESKGGEEGTHGKWRIVNEFRYANELALVGTGIVPVLLADSASGTPAFIELRISNFNKTKSVLVNTTCEVASATQLIPGLRMVYSLACANGRQGEALERLTRGVLPAQMWEVDTELWPNGEPCQLEVRASNMNTIIPGEYPKPFKVVTYNYG